MADGPKIYVAGHRGLVGSAIVRALQEKEEKNIVVRTRDEVNLTSQQQVQDFFKQEQPDQVYLAAAKVGGIHANNTYPADFIYENIMISANILHAAFQNGVKKLLFLGSSCIYPKNTMQPMNEKALLTGVLEPTNEPYAIAKIAGIKMCESYNRQFGTSDGIDYRSLMPTNLYGPGDNYHPENSHVIPSLIYRFHQAKIEQSPTVKLWGTGKPKREFLHVDDMASACLHVMALEKNEYKSCVEEMASHINVGYGSDISINEVAQLVAKTVKYQGEIIHDSSKSDGTFRKLLDSSKLRSFGWKPKIKLLDGLISTYQNYLIKAPR